MASGVEVHSLYLRVPTPETSFNADCFTGRVSGAIIKINGDCISRGLQWDFLNCQAGPWVASATFIVHNMTSPIIIVFSHAVKWRPDGNRRGSPQVFTSERANSWTSYHAACNTGQVSCVTIQMKRMNAVSPGLSWDFLDHQAGSWVASATFNEPEVLLP